MQKLEMADKFAYNYEYVVKSLLYETDSFFFVFWLHIDIGLSAMGASCALTWHSSLFY